MKNVLRLLANPVLVAIVSLLLALPLISRDLNLEEYLWAIPFVFIIISVPFVALSTYTRSHLKESKRTLRLAGMWLGAVVAALAWTYTLLSSSGSTAGIGFIYMGVVVLGGAAAGYFLTSLFRQQKK